MTCRPTRCVAGRAILCSDSRLPLQPQRYHYEFWVDHPPRLLLGQAPTPYLRETGMADSVIDVDSGVYSAYLLGMRLLKFEQALDEHSAGVEVAIEITASSLSSAASLLTKVYE